MTVAKLCSGFAAKKKEPELDVGFVPRSFACAPDLEISCEISFIRSYHCKTLDVNKHFPYVADSECQHLLPFYLSAPDGF